MKSVLLAAALFLNINTVFANQWDQQIYGENQDIAGNPLQQNMKKISSLFKSIGGSVSDSSQNQASAQQAEQLVSLFNQAQQMVPDSIASLPSSEQQAAMNDYKSMLQNEADLSKKLAIAFKQNDNNTANAILNQINGLKKEGHNKYK